MRTFNKVLFCAVIAAWIPHQSIAQVEQAGEPQVQVVAESDTSGATAALGALNATAQATMAGQSGAGVFIAAGTLIGTVTPEVSYEATATNWHATTFFDSAAGTGLQTPNVVFASANPATQLSITVPGGAKFIRVRVSAFTSGTANATVTATNANTSSMSVPNSGLPVVVQNPITGTSPGVAAPANDTISVQNPSLDPCQTQAHLHATISVSTTSNQSIITAVAAKNIYICHLFLMSGVAGPVAVMEGTGSGTCTGGTVAGVIGGATAATGVPLIAGQGWVEGTGSNFVGQTHTVNQNVCLIPSNAGVLSGSVVYVTN